jgi:valyl-tRNA synthetase
MAPKSQLPAIFNNFATKYSVEAEQVGALLAKTCFGTEVTYPEMTALLIVADQYNLNPFTKEIYAFPKKGGGFIPVIAPIGRGENGETLNINADFVAAQIASALEAEMEIYVPLAGIIDFELETTRLNKELAKAQKELAQVEKKLANEKFLAKAPAEVVAKEKAKQEALAAKAAKVTNSLEKIRQMAAGR